MATPAGHTERNHQWLLASRPQGKVTESNFNWAESPVPEITEGQIVVRVIYLSLDPAGRRWMEPVDSYMPMLKIGDVMRGGTLGVVETSRNPGFSPGDIVHGLGGWQEYYAGDATGWRKLPRVPGIPLTAFMGAIGHIGFTAYFGLMDIGKPKPGETQVVSAAAGAVGSIAGQIGKIAGCRVVGIAGSEEKCAWITKELGFDAAINYKKENIQDALKRACPKGIDVDFENVGGEILNAVLGQINVGARVVLCGLISQYNASGPVPGPSNFAAIQSKRARVQGMVVSDYTPRFPEAAAQIIQWLAEKKLKYRIDMVEGLRCAPAAMNKFFDGTNTGKLVVKVSEEPV